MSISAPASPESRLGEFIIARRRELGISQFELSQRLGYQPSQLYELEHSRVRVPTLPTLKKLAVALETGLDPLLDALGYGGDGDAA